MHMLRSIFLLTSMQQQGPPLLTTAHVPMSSSIPAASQGFVQASPSQLTGENGSYRSPATRMMASPSPMSPNMSPSPTKAMQVSESDPSQAGVGIYFQQTPEGSNCHLDKIFVKSIIPGSSADREGTVKIGDFLVSVNEQRVPGSAIHLLRSLIIGEVGTFVKLGFRREDGEGQVAFYEISLMRANQEFFNQLQAKAQIQKDAEQLRSSLVQAEQELSGLRQKLQATESLRMRSLVASAEEQLRILTNSLSEEEEERKQLEIKLRREQVQQQQDEEEAKRLEMLLSQAQDKLRSAEESLQVRTTAYTPMYLDGVEVASSAHGDLDMEEERSNWLMLIPEDTRSSQPSPSQRLEDHQKSKEEEELSIRSLEMRRQQLEEELKQEEAENEQLMQSVAEAEQSYQDSEQVLHELRDKNTELQRQLSELEGESEGRQQHLETLKEVPQAQLGGSTADAGWQRIRAEQKAWEEKLHKEQKAHEADELQYKAREQELLLQMERIGKEADVLKQEAVQRERSSSGSDVSDIKLKWGRQLEDTLAHLESENARVQPASLPVCLFVLTILKLQKLLETEDELAQALKERMQVIGDQLSKVEAELSLARGAREDVTALPTSSKLSPPCREKKRESERVEQLKVARRELEAQRKAKENQLREEEELYKYRVLPIALHALMLCQTYRAEA
ncbi:hypothetical protein GUITHDRAFT_134134 [Guillardia theta CCMP2712]|uniref:PDZ domain-containing protein n=1 Tax=Guillardia theta (strain CCMP2712) TaxID=905079 RepID=L1JTQ2_GUITC|nr:hypothetical protein GUITHDRAFT_134134 [Guillardia theta CCMP2712]EKX51777.1 hypothetical protein GUITHDRAFT_134134 [Guillardia theta CCMP2712]|eukprot:XP_005838757.1 hypothetical protein GUITHDRAFT_134134 [Guillardia theta CCMP2712]